MIPPFRLSKRGVDFIKRWEGLRLERYLDSAGKPTIGYGHLLLPGDLTMSITQSEANAFLTKDIRIVEADLDDLVMVPLTLGQVDALGSWVFNLGRVRLRSSTLLRKLNQKDYLGARAEFLRWVYIRNPKTGKPEKSAGLLRRREAEVKMYG